MSLGLSSIVEKNDNSQNNEDSLNAHTNKKSKKSSIKPKIIICKLESNKELSKESEDE